jgi:hypothetical protein
MNLKTAFILDVKVKSSEVRTWRIFKSRDIRLVCFHGNVQLQFLISHIALIIEKSLKVVKP